MPKTVQVQLSDAAIKRCAADLDVGELKDPRFPLRFRYRNDRSKGSWHVVRYVRGSAKWRKAGNWPDIPVKTMLDNLPRVSARLLADPKASATVDAWASAEPVLSWYAERVKADRNLSDTRKSTVLSAINRHLLPRLGGVPLDELTPGRLDADFFQPMQAEWSLSHVKSVFGVLMTAFRRALGLRKLATNPLADVTFAQFSKTKIKPKGARLRHVSVVELLAGWAEQFDNSPLDVALAVMMLAHGNRISETRLAKWANVNLLAAEWFIPAKNTKAKRDHVLPLTPQAVAFLNRYRDSQKARGYSGAFLFPSPKKPGQPITRSYSFDCFKRLGAGEWTSHDLRKLARTTWAELGVDSLVGKLLLNHALGELDSTYVQTHGQALKRDGLARWHAWLDVQGFAVLHDKTAARRAEMPKPTDPTDWLVCAAD